MLIWFFIIISISGMLEIKSDTTAQPNTIKQDEIYKSLFKLKHSEQLQVVKQVLGKASYSKQYKIVEIILDGIAKVVGPAKVVLENEGYIPGEEFPTKDNVKEALSSVMENTVLFSEILLRLPDITHHHLKKHKENRLFTWAVVFCFEMNLVDDVTQRLLALAANELELVPYDPNYVNPYRLQSIPEKQVVEPVKQKKKKTRTRGPQMSNRRHNEL